MNQNDKPSNKNPDLLTVLENAPIRHQVAAIVLFMGLGTAVIKFGPYIMPLGVAENLGATLYTVAAGLTCSLALKLYNGYKRT
jgi:Na+-transporting methylmalonyl-CoA/oxaloacetate decarboxylase beta subunit